MIGLGTIVNAAAVLLGALLGVFLKKGVPEKISTAITTAIGLSVMMMGVSGTLSGLLTVTDGGLQTTGIMMMIGSLIIGAVLGEVIDIDARLNRFGDFLSKKLTKGGDAGGFSKGFVNASILYCVGAMSIIGALEDGILRDPTTLFAKAVLDGVTAIIFASSLGIGVSLSAISILIYQGTITALSFIIAPILTDLAVAQLSMVGSILIMCIGLNMLNITKIKVANLILATFIPVLYAIITQFI